MPISGNSWDGEVIYDATRWRTDEPGFAAAYLLSDHHATLETSGACIEEATGFVTGIPYYLPTDTGLNEFLTHGGTWREISEWGLERKKFIAQVDTRGSGSDVGYTLHSHRAFGRNEAFFVNFTLFAPSTNTTKQVYNFYFGSRWRLQLFGSGEGSSERLRWFLYHTKRGSDSFFSPQNLLLVAEGQVVDWEKFFNEPWLVFVFPIGNNFLLLRTNKRLRLNRYHSNTIPISDTETAVISYEPLLRGSPLEGDIVVSVPYPMMSLHQADGLVIVRGGYEWAITEPSAIHFTSSGGGLVFGWRLCGFPQQFHFVSPVIRLNYPADRESTQNALPTYRYLGQEDTARWEWVLRSSTHSRCRICKSDGTTDYTIPFKEFRYRIECLSPGTGYTPFVKSLKVHVAPTVVSIPGTPTDISHLVKRIVIRKSLQTDNDAMEIEFVDRDTSLFFGRRNRLGKAIQFKLSGTSQFIGRVRTPEYTHDSEHPKVKVSLPRLGSWLISQFRFAYVAEDFSGVELSTAVDSILAYAGIPPNKRSQISNQVGSTGVYLPVGGGEPRYLPAPNTTAAELLNSIMTEFAPDWELLEDGDGNWTLNKRDTSGPPRKIFYSRTDEARGHYGGETDFQIRRSPGLTETTDDAVNEYANDIYVIGVSFGEDPETGSGLVVGHDAEPRAWEDPEYEFYVGEKRTLVILNPSIPTKALASKVARQMLTELKQFRRSMTLRCDWDTGLPLGKPVEVRLWSKASGGGGTYVLSIVNARVVQIEAEVYPTREEMNVELDTRFLQ